LVSNIAVADTAATFVVAAVPRAESLDANRLAAAAFESLTTTCTWPYDVKDSTT
jgi:hypothetical protein